MLVKLLIYSQTSTAGPLKVENGWIILSHTLLGTWLLVHAGIKVNPLHWRGATGGWISSTAYWSQFIPDYWFCWIIIHVSPIKDLVISRIGNGHSATHPKLSDPDCIQKESCLLLCFIFPSPPLGDDIWSLLHSHGFVDKKEELLFIWLCNWEWSKLRLSYWKLWYVLLKF